VRIAHVSDAFLPRLGGIERTVHDLATRQLIRGHDIEIVTSVPGEVLDPELAGIRIHRPPQHAGDPQAVQYRSCFYGRDAVLRGGFDMVHIHASTLSPLGYFTLISTARAGIPTLVTVHSLWNKATPIFQAVDQALTWRDWPIQWSAVSSVAARWVERATSHVPTVEVLPNGVNTAAWEVPERRPRQPGEPVVIASVMRLAARKRPGHLLRMLHEVKRRLPAGTPVKAVIVGDGPQLAQIRRLVGWYGLQDMVELVGRASQPEIKDILARSDIYVAPAHLESFGLAVLEARCTGLPVVAYANTGIKDFISHEQEGLLVSGDNGMIDALVRLVTDHDLRNRITRHNQAASPPFDWETVLEQCEYLYDRAFALVGQERGAGLDSPGLARAAPSTPSLDGRQGSMRPRLLTRR
jgi:glycosyltransferase involved in cell wall biosynthesis